MRIAGILLVVSLVWIYCGPSSQFPLVRPAVGSHEDDKDYLAVEFYILGNRYYAQDHTALAFQAYRKAIEYEPENLFLRTFIASRAIESNRAGLAIELLGKRPAGPRTAQEWKLLGEAFLKADRIDKAKHAFQKAVELNPNDADVYYALGLIHEARQEVAKSIEAFRNARRLKGGSREADEKAAMMYMQLRMMDSAAAILARLIEENPDDIKYTRTLAKVYETAGKDSAAIALYKSILEQDPENERTRVALGNLYLRKGKWQQSIALFKILYQDNPENRSYGKTLAVLYFEKEQYDSAEVLFQELASRSENDASPHYYLGVIYSEQGLKIGKDNSDTVLARDRYDMALIELNKAIALKKDFVEAWIQLGITHLRMEQDAEALATFEKASKLFPTNARIHYLQGVSCQAVKKYDRAIEAFQRALKADPKYKRALFELGASYEQAGKFDAAAKTFQKLLQLDPEHALALNYLGYMWADRDEHLGQAKKLIQRALKIEPDNAAFLDSYGWILFRLGRFREAEEYVGKAIASTKKPDPVLFDHLGDIYRAMDNLQGAKEYWTKALEIEPENKSIQKKLKQNLR